MPILAGDITGKLIRTLIANQATKPGYYNQRWNCTDNRNRGVAAGIYFYRLVVRGHDSESRRFGSCPQTRTRKLVIAR